MISAMPKIPRREREALALQLYARQVGRKAPEHGDPNDRRYDKNVARRASKLRPEAFDNLLRGEDTDQ